MDVPAEATPGRIPVTWSSEAPISVGGTPPRRLRIAALLKQIPSFDAMELGPDGRLVREGLALEMNPYCRRAVTAAVTLGHQTGGSTVAISLGPPAARAVLREAIAGGMDRAVLLTDPEFAGSDSLATALALAAVIRMLGGFDLVVMGRNSVDSDTAQVGPELSELLDVAFMAGARSLRLDGDTVTATLEHDDGWMVARASYPLVISCAERLCNPCKEPQAADNSTLDDRIRVVTASELGQGPWGWSASPTMVGELRSYRPQRHKRILVGGTITQADQIGRLLAEMGTFSAARRPLSADAVPQRSSDASRTTIGVLLELWRPRLARELLGRAAVLGASIGASVTAIVPGPIANLDALGQQGADHVLLVEGIAATEDAAGAVTQWCETVVPWAVLAPSTMWGREVAGRVAARLGAGLTGDAIDLEVRDGRLLGWKPALGGQVVAAISSVSATQLVTVRPGVLPVMVARPEQLCDVATICVGPRRRVEELESGRDDDIDLLGSATVVIGVGAGVDRRDHDRLRDLGALIGAELGATRKVTDDQLMPRARQIGITGRSISPDLYIAVGISGRPNHMLGVRAAGTIVAINSDSGAAIFESCDIGIVADWKVVLPELCRAISEHLVPAPGLISATADAER